MFKLLFAKLVLSLIIQCVLLSEAQLSNFKNCNYNNYPIELSTLIFNPDPIQIGKSLITEITGTSTTKISPGSIMTAYFNYNGILFETKAIDLCIELIEKNDAKCPVEAGNFKIVSKSIPFIGSNYPKNSTYKFDTTFTGKK